MPEDDLERTIGSLLSAVVRLSRQYPWKSAGIKRAKALYNAFKTKHRLCTARRTKLKNFVARLCSFALTGPGNFHEKGICSSNSYFRHRVVAWKANQNARQPRRLFSRKIQPFERAYRRNVTDYRETVEYIRAHSQLISRATYRDKQKTTRGKWQRLNRYKNQYIQVKQRLGGRTSRTVRSWFPGNATSRRLPRSGQERTQLPRAYRVAALFSAPQIPILPLWSLFYNLVRSKNFATLFHLTTMRSSRLL